MNKIDLWSTVSKELSHSLTHSTYTQWFLGSRLLEFNDGRALVGLQTAAAVEVATARFVDLVSRTFSYVAETAVTDLSFVLLDETNYSPGVATAAVPRFPGFEPFQANFTTVPRQFFTAVIPDGPPSVVAFVGAVIDQTLGVIINYHTGERREWWEASYSLIGATAGLQGRASIAKAIRLSRLRGYVVRSPGRSDLRYRLRRLGEPIDTPVDNYNFGVVQKVNYEVNSSISELF